MINPYESPLADAPKLRRRHTWFAVGVFFVADFLLMAFVFSTAIFGGSVALGILVTLGLPGDSVFCLGVFAGASLAAGIAVAIAVTPLWVSMARRVHNRLRRKHG